MIRNIEEELVIRPVGDLSQSAITRLDTVGNVVVRACEVFSEAQERMGRDAAVEFCRDYCPVRDIELENYRGGGSVGVDCPEKNTLLAYARLGIKPDQAITVAVTDNGVGFSDQIDYYIEESDATINPEGWTDVKGFNAFFADTSKGTLALGRRLADCGDLNIEFMTKDGRTIIGFIHLTRPNQTVGKDVYMFGEDMSEPKSYFEFALGKALRHFGEVDMQSVSLSLRTAIDAKDFIKRFDSEEAREQHLPGWYDDGFLSNATNPDWKEGDQYDPEDKWNADFKGLIIRDIKEGMANLGISLDKLDTDEMLDTINNTSHSSHERATRNGTLDTRDLYVTSLDLSRTTA